jgi:hypothetical protein
MWALLFFFLQDEPLHVGASSVDITPPVETFEDKDGNERYSAGENFNDLNKNGKFDPVWMAGFNVGKSALGVHDPLWARAISMRVGKERVVLVALDLVGMLHFQIEKIQKELPDVRVIVACTHNHSGPDTLGLWGAFPGLSGLSSAYMDSVKEKIVQAVKFAIERETEATMTPAFVKIEGLIKDSRDPKIMNEQVEGLLFKDKEGKTIATLVSVACHPEGVGKSNRQITSDFPHYLRLRLEKEYPGSTAVYCSADVGALQTPVKHRWEGIQAMGESIAESMIAAFAKATAQPASPFAYKRHEFEFRLDNPIFRAALKGGLFGAKDVGVREDGNTIFLNSSVTAIRLGRVSFVTLPGEVAPELGQKILEMMPGERKILLGLANDEVGYIFRKEDWKPGEYEESMSLGPETGPLLMEALRKVLDRP